MLLRPISAPKDVSIAYLVGGDERIATWWKEAVADTVKEIEASTATRIRKGGSDDKDRVVLRDKRIIPRQFTYGYVTTSHASQGKSIDRGIVLMAGDGIKAANLKQPYRRLAGEVLRIMGRPHLEVDPREVMSDIQNDAFVFPMDQVLGRPARKVGRIPLRFIRGRINIIGVAEDADIGIGAIAVENGRVLVSEASE